MATAAQLRKHKEARRTHGERVAAMEASVKQALALATAQLAASLADRRILDPDITKRVGFNPGEPTDVLWPDEHRRLAEAQVIVNALATFVNGSLRLENQELPRISGGAVSRGRL